MICFFYCMPSLLLCYTSESDKVLFQNSIQKTLFVPGGKWHIEYVKTRQNEPKTTTVKTVHCDVNRQLKNLCSLQIFFKVTVKGG